MPDKAYSYVGKKVDVNKLNKATVTYKRNNITAEVKIKALNSSVKDLDTSVVGEYPDQVEYEFREEIKKSDLVIYENEAPNVSLKGCSEDACTTEYTSGNWINEDVEETINVSDYVHGKFEEIQVYDTSENKWVKFCDLNKTECSCSGKSCNTKNVVSTGQESTKISRVRSIDEWGNVSKEADYTINIDKIARMAEIDKTVSF